MSGTARSHSALRVWTWAIVATIAVWLVLRTFVIEAFRIPSGSMESTLLPGDLLFVRKLRYVPRRGDLVVFQSVEDSGRKLVKRLVGLPGDTLAMENGALVRNGAPVPEPYAVSTDPSRSVSPAVRERMRAWQLPHLAAGDPGAYFPDLHDWGPVVVPPDSLFFLGDNRDASYDGRYWGFVPRQSVRGHPFLIYFSCEPSGWRAPPFPERIRWRRILSSPE